MEIWRDGIPTKLLVSRFSKIYGFNGIGGEGGVRAVEGRKWDLSISEYEIKQGRRSTTLDLKFLYFIDIYYCRLLFPIFFSIIAILKYANGAFLIMVLVICKYRISLSLSFFHVVIHIIIFFSILPKFVFFLLLILSCNKYLFFSKSYFVFPFLIQRVLSLERFYYIFHPFNIIFESEWYTSVGLMLGIFIHRHFSR